MYPVRRTTFLISFAIGNASSFVFKIVISNHPPESSGCAVTAFYYTRFFGNVKHFCINMHEKFLLTALFWIIFILNEYFGAFFCIYAFPMHKAHKNRKRCPPLQQSRHSVSSDETFHFLQILQIIGSGIRSFIGCQNFTDK